MQMNRFPALFFIILLIPIYLILSLLIYITSGNPIIFKQRRPGKNGKIFILYKFRTMSHKQNNNVEFADKERISTFGHFMRAYSLDELVTLFNVLKGDMVFVGPRPLLPEYLAFYSKEQRRRHEVKPGITGLAQVCGRNMITWEEKFKLDIYYIDNKSLWLDLKILLLTIKTVFKREGVCADGHATMPPFKGSK